MIDYDPDRSLTGGTFDAGWDGRLRVDPEPDVADEDLAARARQTMDRIAPPIPVSAPELAALAHDALASRGWSPRLDDDNRAQVEAAAGDLLTALGVGAP